MKTIHIDLKVGQTMRVAGVSVSLEEKSGQRARLRVVAPPGVDVEPPSRTQGAEQAKMGAILERR